jgi:hypothetical protein
MAFDSSCVAVTKDATPRLISQIFRRRMMPDSRHRCPQHQRSVLTQRCRLSSRSLPETFVSCWNLKNTWRYVSIALQHHAVSLFRFGDAVAGVV